VERALLLMVRLIGAITANALWFAGSGGGLAWDSETECFSDVHGRAVKQIAMGVTSAVVSSLPVLLLSLCNTRSFRPVDGFSDEKLRCLLRWWLLSDVLVVVAAVIFNLVCSFFLLSFLARLSLQDQWDWVSRTVATVSVEFVLTPLLLSLFWSMAASVVLHDTFSAVHREVSMRSNELRVSHIASQLESVSGEEISNNKYQAPCERNADEQNGPKHSDSETQISMELVQLESCSWKSTPRMMRCLPSRFVGPDVPHHPGDDDGNVTF